MWSHGLRIYSVHQQSCHLISQCQRERVDSYFTRWIAGHCQSVVSGFHELGVTLFRSEVRASSGCSLCSCHPFPKVSGTFLFVGQAKYSRLMGHSVPSRGSALSGGGGGARRSSDAKIQLGGVLTATRHCCLCGQSEGIYVGVSTI